jgi:hypothetical protein
MIAIEGLDGGGKTEYVVEKGIRAAGNAYQDHSFQIENPIQKLRQDWS